MSSQVQGWQVDRELPAGREFDCVVCGSCTVDILVRPFPLETPVGGGRLLRVDPIQVDTGGLVSNAGIAMARLGLRVAALTMVGDDGWGSFVRTKYQQEGIDTRWLVTHESAPSSATVVLVDDSGERSFAHSQGAPKLVDRSFLLDHRALFARSRMLLIGYYSLLPRLEEHLVELLPQIRELGCRTALDAAGTGGGLQPLDRILPHLDVYVPSYAEASQQTGETDVARIIQVYRDCGATGLVGVKLGSRGAILSPRPGSLISIPAVSPPGPVVDTTGAGDAFNAGLLAGLLQGWDIETAGRLAAASGACCVAALGASAGLRNLPETVRIAGISAELVAQATP